MGSECRREFGNAARKRISQQSETMPFTKATAPAWAWAFPLLSAFSSITARGWRLIQRHWEVPFFVPSFLSPRRGRCPTSHRSVYHLVPCTLFHVFFVFFLLSS